MGKTIVFGHSGEDYEQAIYAFEQIYSRNTGWEVGYNLAILYEASGRLIDARRIIRDIHEQYPDNKMVRSLNNSLKNYG